MDEQTYALLDWLLKAETMGGLALLLALESARPLYAVAGLETQAKHILVNFSLWVISFLIVDAWLFPLLYPTSLDATGWIWTASLADAPLWLQVVVGVLLLDLSSWVLHWLSHRYRWLWLIHMVHHSDPRIDVSTAIRNHPIEAVISLLWHGSVLAVFGLPLWILVCRALLSIPVSLFNHSNVRLPERTDRLLRRVIVSPAMHRVHHSPRQEETNSNYAGIFSFWDRLFGTYRPPRASSAPDFGLDALRAPEWQTLWGLLMTPLKARHFRSF